jgi:uncharacterized membrane protein
MLACSSIEVLYLLLFKPFSVARLNKLELLNELTLTVLTYFMFSFTQYVSDAQEFRQGVGWAFIFFVAFNVTVHFVLMLIDSMRKIIYWIRIQAKKYRDKQRVKRLSTMVALRALEKS